MLSYQMSLFFVVLSTAIASAAATKPAAFAISSQPSGGSPNHLVLSWLPDPSVVSYRVQQRAVTSGAVFANVGSLVSRASLDALATGAWQSAGAVSFAVGSHAKTCGDSQCPYEVYTAVVPLPASQAAMQYRIAATNSAGTTYSSSDSSVVTASLNNRAYSTSFVTSTSLAASSVCSTANPNFPCIVSTHSGQITFCAVAPAYCAKSGFTVYTRAFGSTTWSAPTVVAECGVISSLPSVQTEVRLEGVLADWPLGLTPLATTPPTYSAVVAVM